jgi:Phasin protein
MLKKLLEVPMESKNPFDAVRSMMEDNLSKVGNATKNYLELLQKSMLSVPNANADQVDFKAHIERQVAASQAFIGELLNAKDIKEAMQIQVEYFQSQMRTSVNDAMQLTDKMAAMSKRSAE